MEGDGLGLAVVLEGSIAAVSGESRNKISNRSRLPTSAMPSGRAPLTMGELLN